MLTGLFTFLLGPRGPLVFMALVIGVSLWLIRTRPLSAGPLRAGTLGAMLGESIILALLFGLVVIGTVTMRLLGPLRSLAAGAGTGGIGGTVLERLTLSIGAGLYEELLFRVVIVALLANGFRLLGIGRVAAGIAATVLGALLFSALFYFASNR